MSSSASYSRAAPRRLAPSRVSGPAPARRPSVPRVIAVVAFDGISPFQLAAPCLLFGEDRSELGVPRFDLRVCALDGSSLLTRAGFAIHTEHRLSALSDADVVIVPTW